MRFEFSKVFSKYIDLLLVIFNLNKLFMQSRFLPDCLAVQKPIFKELLDKNISIVLGNSFQEKVFLDLFLSRSIFSYEIFDISYVSHLYLINLDMLQAFIGALEYRYTVLRLHCDIFFVQCVIQEVQAVGKEASTVIVLGIENILFFGRERSP